MSQTLILVSLFVVGIACLPFLVRWAQARAGMTGLGAGQAKVLSVVAVGPQQRVVTLQVGAGSKEAVLVLGVTAASVQCLHKWVPDADTMASGAASAVQSHGR